MGDLTVLTIQFGRNYKFVRGQLRLDGVDNFKYEPSAVLQAPSVLDRCHICQSKPRNKSIIKHFLPHLFAC